MKGILQAGVLFYKIIVSEKIRKLLKKLVLILEKNHLFESQD